MTDRHAGYVVTLTDDIREDDAEAIINALRLIKGVASVQPVVGDHQLVIAKERVREEYRAKLTALLRELS
ncbi:hypothetical protein [Streptomyces sp. NPDC055105]|uniref:hypothetical protein n=1 Tax=Streptomyces sp. NPDC055105 TaxID=3365719 RepID=UPI0037CF6D66